MAPNAQLCHDARAVTNGANVHKAGAIMMLYVDACERNRKRDVARYERKLRGLLYGVSISEACAIVTFRAASRRAS